MKIFKNLIDNLLGATKRKFNYADLSNEEEEREFYDDEAALHILGTGVTYSFADLVQWIEERAASEGKLTNLARVPKGVEADVYILHPYRFIIYQSGIEILFLESESVICPAAFVSRHGLFRPPPHQTDTRLREFIRFFNAQTARDNSGTRAKRIYGTYLADLDRVTPEDFPTIRQMLLDRGIEPIDLTYVPRRLKKCEIFVQFRTYCKYIHDQRILPAKEQKKSAQDEVKRAAQEARRVDDHLRSEARISKKEEKRIKREARLEANRKAKEIEKEENRLRHAALLEEHKQAKKCSNKPMTETHEQKSVRLERHRQQEEFHRQRKQRRQRLLEAITAIVAAESNDEIASELVVQQAAFFLIRMTEEVLIFEENREDEEHYTYYITDGFALNVQQLCNERFALVAKAFTLCSDSFPPTVTKILHDEIGRRVAAT